MYHSRFYLQDKSWSQEMRKKYPLGFILALLTTLAIYLSSELFLGIGKPGIKGFFLIFVIIITIMIAVTQEIMVRLRNERIKHQFVVGKLIDDLVREKDPSLEKILNIYLDRVFQARFVDLKDVFDNLSNPSRRCLKMRLSELIELASTEEVYRDRYLKWELEELLKMKAALETREE